jgi:hypothetical protein
MSLISDFGVQLFHSSPNGTLAEMGWTAVAAAGAIETIGPENFSKMAAYLAALMEFNLKRIGKCDLPVRVTGLAQLTKEQCQKAQGLFVDAIRRVGAYCQKSGRTDCSDLNVSPRSLYARFHPALGAATEAYMTLKSRALSVM